MKPEALFSFQYLNPLKNNIFFGFLHVHLGMRFKITLAPVEPGLFVHTSGIADRLA